MATETKPIKSIGGKEVEETKAEKFTRITGGRMDKALLAIATVGNTANKAAYDFTEEQIASMEKALNTGVKETIGRFRSALAGKTVKAKSGFNF